MTQIKLPPINPGRFSPLEYEYTGAGYFLTLSESWLPEEDATLSCPAVVGSCSGVDSGFVVFLGKNELTLECHTWGELDVPDNYRDQAVEISTPKINKVDLR